MCRQPAEQLGWKLLIWVCPEHVLLERIATWDKGGDHLGSGDSHRVNNMLLLCPVTCLVARLFQGMQGKSVENLSRGLEYAGLWFKGSLWVFLIVTSCRLPKLRLREYFAVFVSMCNGWMPCKVLPTLSGIAREVK